LDLVLTRTYQTSKKEGGKEKRAGKRQRILMSSFPFMRGGERSPAKEGEKKEREREEKKRKCPPSALPCRLKGLGPLEKERGKRRWDPGLTLACCCPRNEPFHRGRSKGPYGRFPTPFYARGKERKKGREKRERKRKRTRSPWSLLFPLPLL